MTETTEYATWGGVDPQGHRTVEDALAVILGEHGDDYDVQAVAHDWREAINAALPAGVTLAGNVFYGPYPADSQTWAPELTDEDGHLNLRAVVDAVDFWEIADQHVKTT